MRIWERVQRAQEVCSVGRLGLAPGRGRQLGSRAKTALIVLIGSLSMGWASPPQVSVNVNEGHVIEAQASYARPLDVLWEVLRQPTEFPKFQSRIYAVELVGLLDGAERYFVKVRMPGLLPDMWNVVSVQAFDQEKRMVWEKLEGNLLHHEGNVHLRPRGAYTDLSVEMRLRALSFLPTQALSWSVRPYITHFLNELDDAARALQAERAKTQPGANKITPSNRASKPGKK